jgi:hypothetical protein
VGPDRGADPACPNQYAYAGGAPFSAADPSGLVMTGAEVRFGCNLADRMESLAPELRVGLSLARLAGRGPMRDLTMQRRLADIAARAELARQIEEWNRRNAGELKAVYPFERPLQGPIIGLFANDLPSHGEVVFVFERIIYLVQSKFWWFSNRVTMTPIPQEPSGEKIDKSAPFTPLFQVTAEMLYEWVNDRNSEWRFYVPCWPFPDNVADDCHTTVFELMNWLGAPDYDAARPHPPAWGKRR